MRKTAASRLGRTAMLVALAAVLVSASVTGAQELPGPLPSPPASVSAGTPFVALQTLYAEDFEQGDGGFTASGTASWEYGVPVSPPTTAPGQGPNMWGTVLAGTYANLACSFLQSAPIDLSGVPALPDTDVTTLGQLTFRHWLHVENRFDGGAVYASSDGATWTLLVPKGGYPNTPLTTAKTCLGLGDDDRFYTTPSSPEPAADAWKVAEFDITPYLGGPLHLRWGFASDSSVVKRGWYVDDILVQLGVSAGVTAAVPESPEPQFTPVTSVYAEDFEATDGGWTPEGTGAWEWGEPIAPPVPLPGSSKLWGTRLGSDYTPNECATLTSPQIVLPGADPAGQAELARMTFAMWRHLETSFDGAIVQVSADGGPFTYVASANYDRSLSSLSSARACLGIATAVQTWSGPSTAPADDVWEQGIVNLTAFMGHAIQVRFVFGSDVDTEKRGLYIDDLAIALGFGPKIDPQNPPGQTFPGWTESGTNESWEYGVPTTGPASVQPVYATNLNGNYNPSECSALVSPAVDTSTVAGLGSLSVRFSHYFESFSTDDGGVLQVSTDDGANWTTLTPVGGYNSNLSTSARGCIAPGATTFRGWSGVASGGEYQQREAVLGSAYEAKTIRVRFLFGSGSSSEDFGWYLRSVQLTKGGAPVTLLP